MEMAEPNGPCPCGGTICKNAFGWIWGSIQDLQGNMHSGRYDVKVCEMYPQELMEWDAEDGLFLPPPPPGMSIESIKGFMGTFKGTEKDLQKGDSGIVTSERKHEEFNGGWQDGNA